MKVWQSYGAEHSMKLVIIGQFKEVEEAEEFKTLVDSLTNFLSKQKDYDMDSDRFSKEVLDFLREINIYSLSPQQLEQFLLDKSLEQNGNEIRITSDDDLNAYFSLLILKGAKVEAYSTHDYPEDKIKEV